MCRAAMWDMGRVQAVVAVGMAGWIRALRHNSTKSRAICRQKEAASKRGSFKEKIMLILKNEWAIIKSYQIPTRL